MEELVLEVLLVKMDQLGILEQLVVVEKLVRLE
jgi:hypothetical protein